nr:DUF971 domain-containing protein [Rhizobium sp. 11515TR]
MGRRRHLSHSRLRAAPRSRDAEVLRASLDGRDENFDNIQVADIEPIGSYGVRLVFSDGHDRGIYPWQYLREIADSLA